LKYKKLSILVAFSLNFKNRNKINSVTYAIGHIDYTHTSKFNHEKVLAVVHTKLKECCDELKGKPILIN